MPREQYNLTGTIIIDKANQTNKEIIVWLDNEDKKEQDEYNKLESEFIRNDNRHTENGQKEIWARLTEEHARDSEQYILQNRIYSCNITILGSIIVLTDHLWSITRLTDQLRSVTRLIDCYVTHKGP